MNEFEYKRPPFFDSKLRFSLLFCENDAQRSRAILMNSLESKDKVEERKAMLANHPELRRRVDLQRLKKIIDFQDFKCHPKSSVARDMAIEGSDIDFGLVILKEPEPLERQREFIRELRKQGFVVFHRQDYQELHDQGERSGNKQERNRLQKKADGVLLAVVEFYPDTELKEMSKKTVSPVTMVYLAGTSIAY